MNTYLIGNLLGRLLISYGLVWLVMFLLFSRFNWRTAFSKTHAWYGLLSVTILFGLGLASALNQGTLL